jgi:hypothetical protein
MALLQKGYLGATPLFRDVAWYEDGAFQFVNISGNVDPVADTAAHTKGAWSPVITSTSANASFLYIIVVNVAATNTDTATLIDIGFGASGSETVVIGDVAVGGAGSGGSLQGAVIGVPFQVPSGTRISARIQSVVTGGKTARVSIVAIDAGGYSTAPTSVDVIGTDTATSKGTEFTGASGQWTLATASTSRAYRAVCPVISIHDSDTANLTTRTYEVGVGASGAEVAFGATRYAVTNNEAAGMAVPASYLLGRNIPAGSRLAVRHDIAANPNKYGFTLIGIP